MKCIAACALADDSPLQDLTESSALGALLSLVSIAVLLALFVLQIKAALAGESAARWSLTA